MYCKHCGKQMDDSAEICVNCGCPTGIKLPPEKTKKRFNVFSFLGFLLSVVGVLWECLVGKSSAAHALSAGFIVCLIAGLILSIIGTVKSRKFLSGKALGILGIVISALAIIVFAGFFILIVFIFSNAGNV